MFPSDSGFEFHCTKGGLGETMVENDQRPIAFYFTVRKFVSDSHNREDELT